MNSNAEALHRAALVTPRDDGNSPEPAPGFRPASEPPPRAPLRLGRLALILAVLLIAGLALGFLPRLKSRAAVRAEGRELSVPTVVVVSPEAATAPRALALSGEVKPLMEASIYARANGYVRRWLVDLGGKVEAGQLLAELDAPEIGRELAQAKAELTEAEAAQALAQTTAKRWQELRAGKTVSAQEADEKAGDLATKTATAQAARANVQRLEQVSGFAQITAPFSGTITARRIDVGQLVNAGSGQELFRLAQIEKLRVFVRVPQSFSRAVAVGQLAELTLPEVPGKFFNAKVVRTAGALDPASRTLLTELEVENSSGEVLAGGYAQVRLPDAKAEAALTLPSNTLLFRPEGPQIAIVVDNHVRLQHVTLGRDFGTVVEILTGADAGERVILNPADSLAEGAEVRVSEPKPAAQ